MVKKLIKELAKASAHILTKRNPAVRTAKNIIERKTAFQQWLKAKRKKDLPKGADLTDVFKGKNIKDPKTFLKKRKEVVGKMTKSRKKEIKERKQELYDEWVEDNVRKHGGDPGDIPKFGKGGVIKTGIRKAAELKKKMVKAREKLSKSKPKGSYYKKLEKGLGEELKAREKLKKLGRGFRKGGKVPVSTSIPGIGVPDRKKQGTSETERRLWHKKRKPNIAAPMTAEQRKEFAKQLLGPGGSKMNELARSIAKVRKPSGTLNKDDLDRAHRVLRGMGLSKTQGMAKGGAVKKRVGQVVQKVKRIAGHLKKVMEKPKKGPFYKKMQEGGEVKGDSEYQDSQLSMDYAKSILDIARKRKPSGVINQDDINAAKEEFNRRRATKEASPATPMPKTSKRSLVKPMDPATRDESKFIQRRNVFTGAQTEDPMRRQEQGRGLGMKEGGSVSSKPKHRGWGKAIKGTKFKGTF